MGSTILFLSAGLGVLGEIFSLAHSYFDIQMKSTFAVVLEEADLLLRKSFTQLGPKTELRSQLEKQWPFTPTKGMSGQSHQFFAHAISATQAYPPIYLFEYRICSLYSQTSEIL